MTSQRRTKRLKGTINYPLSQTPINPTVLARPPVKPTRSPVTAFVDVLASLRLTVVLFALAVVLVFFGTLAQVEQGIWAVMEQYFRTPVAWIDLSVLSALLPGIGHIPVTFPFPGGYLIGGVLVVNLLAAHVVRLRWSVRDIGMQFIHAGLIVMLLSEMVTGLFAVETQMTIFEGSSTNFAEDVRAVELAVIDRRDPMRDRVTVVPGLLLLGAMQQGGRVTDDRLPFDIEVIDFLRNSSLIYLDSAPPGTTSPATHGWGRGLLARPELQATGTDASQTVDYPSAYLEFHDKATGASLGTYLVSLYLDQSRDPQFVDSTAGPRLIALRFKRTYKDYALHLIDFSHDRYMGTNKASNYSSRIRLVDPTRNEDREVLIYMNHPLRYGGETFFQYRPGDNWSGLQIVSNPGWLMPYISCGMVTFGMIYHFVWRLWVSLRREAAA